jgi:hypothetical protein
MKTISQLDAYKAIRKPTAGVTRIVRPLKGCGYRRPQGKKWTNDD